MAELLFEMSSVNQSASTSRTLYLRPDPSLHVRLQVFTLFLQIRHDVHSAALASDHR
jgi:hypothetical protein